MTEHHSECATEQGEGLDPECTCGADTIARLRADVARLTAAQCPPLVYQSNGEAGDGQMVCAHCGMDRDEPHPWAECVVEREHRDTAAADMVHDELIGDADRMRDERDHYREKYLELTSALATVTRERDEARAAQVQVEWSGGTNQAHEYALVHVQAWCFAADVVVARQCQRWLCDMTDGLRAVSGGKT